MRYAICTCLLIFVLPAPAQAQSGFTTFGHDIRDAAHDVLRIWSSPARIRSSDLSTIGLAAGSIVAVGVFDEQIQGWLHQNDRKLFMFEPFRHHSALVHAGELGKLTMFSGALYLTGLAAKSPDLRDAGMGCIASGMSNSIMRHAIYLVLSRARPAKTENAYEIGVPGGNWDHHAFFGGHAANATACTTFWAKRFDLSLAEPVMYIAVGGISVGRTLDGFHWPSDTMTGLIVGYAIGTFIAQRSLRRAANR